MKSLLFLAVIMSLNVYAADKSPSGEEAGKRIFTETFILNSQYKDQAPEKQEQFSKEAEEFARSSCESKGLFNCEIIGTTRKLEGSKSVYTTEVQGSEESTVRNEFEELENKF